MLNTYLIVNSVEFLTWKSISVYKLETASSVKIKKWFSVYYSRANGDMTFLWEKSNALSKEIYNWFGSAVRILLAAAGLEFISTALHTNEPCNPICMLR